MLLPHYYFRSAFFLVIRSEIISASYFELVHHYTYLFTNK